jgi:hypothetical protein
MIMILLYIVVYNNNDTNDNNINNTNVIIIHLIIVNCAHVNAGAGAASRPTTPKKASVRKGLGNATPTSTPQGPGLGSGLGPGLSPGPGLIPDLPQAPIITPKRAPRGEHLAYSNFASSKSLSLMNDSHDLLLLPPAKSGIF